MKKQVVLPILSLLVIIVFAFSLVVPAFANPDPTRRLLVVNKRTHIVRNFLFDNSGVISGWITFACQSVEGFQYSVAVRDLSPTTTYTVQAMSLAEAFGGLDPDGNPIFLPTSDGAGNLYALGTINTNGEGEGEVTGLVPLSSNHAFLPFGLYAFEIQVLDSTDTVILATSPLDPIDFQVFSEWL